MGHKEVPQNWLLPICPGYFRNSKWPFKVLSISSFCGPGLSVIRSGLRKSVVSILHLSPFSPPIPLATHYNWAFKSIHPFQQNSHYQGHQPLHLTKLPEVSSFYPLYSLFSAAFKRKTFLCKLLWHYTLRSVSSLTFDLLVAPSWPPFTVLLSPTSKRNTPNCIFILQAISWVWMLSIS